MARTPTLTLTLALASLAMCACAPTQTKAPNAAPEPAPSTTAEPAPSTTAEVAPEAAPEAAQPVEALRDDSPAAVAQRAEAWDWDKSPEAISADDLERLNTHLLSGAYDGNPEQKLRLAQRYANAQRALLILEQARTKAALAKAQADARVAVTKVADAALKALNDGDKAAFIELIDFDECLRNVKCEGICVNGGDPETQQSPVYYSYEIKAVPQGTEGKSVYSMEFGELQDASYIANSGLDNVFDYFSPTASTVDIAHRKNMKIMSSMRNDKRSTPASEFDVFGVPRELASYGSLTSDHYYSLMFVDVKGLEGYRSAKPLALYIGGRWGEAAKILYVFADIAKPMVTRKRDDDYYAKNPE